MTVLDALKDAKPSDVLALIAQWGEEPIAELLSGLCGPCGALATAPLRALLSLAENIAKEIEAKNEVEAMKAAVQAVNSEVDAEEAEALALKAQLK